MMKDDTLCNVRDGLCTMRELSEAPDFAMTKNAIEGYHMFMTCLVDAINFELYNRK